MQLVKELSLKAKHFSKRNTVLLILLSQLIRFTISAQEKELNATIETIDGTQQTGYILVRPSLINTELVSFRSSKTSDYQVYYPKDLKNYVLDGHLYESHTVDSIEYFLTVIVKGKASLYELTRNQKRRFYIQMSGEERVFWLRHEKLVIPNEGGDKVRLVSYYKAILQDKLADCPTLLKEVKLPNPTLKELKEYVTKYNDCFLGNTYAQKEGQRQVFFGLQSGATFKAENYSSGGFIFDVKREPKRLSLTSFSYRFSRWQDIEKTKNVITGRWTVNMHLFTTQLTVIIYPNKSVEPYFFFEPGLCLLNGTHQYFVPPSTPYTLPSQAGKREGFLIPAAWAGAGLKVRLSERVFSRLSYSLSILGIGTFQLPSNLNLSLSCRINNH